MNGLIVKEEIKIEDMIYEIRGKQVMFASDVAGLYETEVRIINQVVKRNIERFPDTFCFQLTKFEFELLKSQNVIPKQYNTMGRGGNRHLPHVFTEYGIIMLSGLLKNRLATQINVRVIKAFVAMKHYLSNDLLEQKYYNDMTIRHDSEIKLLQESFNKLEEAREVNEIYFNGKIYDAHSKIIDIFSEAKKELIIVDRYTDKTILDMIKNLECKVILITGKNTKLTNLDIEKYNKTYDNLSIYYNDTFHDRYFILDRDKIYHSGNSVNHIGFRKSSIDILMDENVKNTILKDVDSIINNKQ